MKTASRKHGRAEKKARKAREVHNYMGADATVYDEIDANYHN